MKFDHLYNCYPLYDFLYSGNTITKFVESTANARIAHHFLNNIRECPKNKKGKSLSVLEIASGESKHRDFYLMEAQKLGVLTQFYVENELFEPKQNGMFLSHPIVPLQAHKNGNTIKGHDFVFGDATADNFPTIAGEGAYDLVFINFHSVSSLLDQSTQAFRRLLFNAMCCVAHGGALVIDTHADPHKWAYGNLMHGDDEMLVHDVPPCHALRDLVKAPPNGDVKLEVQTATTYNRLTNSISDDFEYVRVVWDGNKKGVKLDIAKPFEQRVRSVTDMVDFFNEHLPRVKSYFYHYGYDSRTEDMTVQHLDMIQSSGLRFTPETDAEIAAASEALMPNKLLLYRP